MKAVRYTLLLALVFTLQTTWVDFLEVWSIKPDLLIVTLSFIALRCGSVVGAYMGLGIGILQDLYSPADLGLNALAKSLIGAGFGYIYARTVADSIPIQTVLVFGAVACHDIICYVGTSADVTFEVARFLGRAVYTGLLGAVCFAALTLKRHLFPA